MRKLFLAVFMILSGLSTAAQAEVTFGLGIGGLYNGIGLNIGRTSNNTLVFGSLGCMALSSTSSETIGSSGDIDSPNNDDDVSTNCGAGLGFVSTSVLPGSRHGLGLSLTATNNKIDKNANGSDLEYRIIPGYYYFMNGIDEGGFNFGAGTNILYNDSDSLSAAFTFNIGFQF